ncbi:hypothetical protein J6590_011952 [Homalodisca vitripennis]|nr:hypothetical protein J6590_011952 [Homalodisca vitripennis]
MVAGINDSLMGQLPAWIVKYQTVDSVEELEDMVQHSVELVIWRLVYSFHPPRNLVLSWDGAGGGIIGNSGSGPAAVCFIELLESVSCLSLNICLGRCLSQWVPSSHDIISCLSLPSYSLQQISQGGSANHLMSMFKNTIQMRSPARKSTVLVIIFIPFSLNNSAHPETI